MSKLTLYIDGSESAIGENKIRQGWGILALHLVGYTEEMNGGVTHRTSDKRRDGWHEILAFYEAIKYAELKGYVPPECSFYTDYAWIAYGGFHLTPQNRSVVKHGMMKRLKRFQKLFYPQEKYVAIKMIRWMIGAQMHWVKGHRGDINNHRVDLLARSAVKCRKPEDCISFSEWLRNGFAKWDNELGAKRLYFAPFIRTFHRADPENLSLHDDTQYEF